MKPYLNFAGNNWVDLLPLVEFNFNSTKNKNGISPFVVDIGRQPELPSQCAPEDIMKTLKTPERKEVERFMRAQEETARIVQQRIFEEQERQERYYNKSRRSLTFNTGDKVLVLREGLDLPLSKGKPRKLVQPWIGPFQIKGKGRNPDTYELVLPTTLKAVHPVFHVDILKPWRDPQGPYRKEKEERPEGILVNGEKEWVPERILKERMFRNKYKEYLVQWEGWPTEYATWETHENMKDTLVYKKYNKQKK
jgi:hypothetical protein